MDRSKCIALVASIVLITSVASHAQEVKPFQDKIKTKEIFYENLHLLRSQEKVKSPNIDALITAGRQSAVPEVVKAAKEEKTSPDTGFEGLGFDAGLSVMLPTGSKPIREAEIREGKVRVTKSAETSITPVLQLHQFWTANERKLGYGPFTAIGFGEDKIIKSVSLGLMLGFRASSDSSQSINIGVGWYWEPNATFLSDEYVDGEKAPDGATKVETVEKTAKGFVITISYKF